MTATHATNAEKIGKLLARRVRDRSDVLSLWARQNDQLAELWLIVDAEDVAEELELRRADADLLQRFPDIDWELRVFDVKLMGTRDLNGFVPHDAVRIEI